MKIRWSVVEQDPGQQRGRRGRHGPRGTVCAHLEPVAQNTAAAALGGLIFNGGNGAGSAEVVK